MLGTILSVLDALYGAVLSGATGYVVSYPPKLHRAIIQAYDYPILRILLFSSVLTMAFYIPVTAIIYGIGIALVSENIMRSSKNAPTEGFTEDTREDANDTENALRIQVAKKMAPIEAALASVKKTEVALQRSMLRKNS